MLTEPFTCKSMTDLSQKINVFLEKTPHDIDHTSIQYDVVYIDEGPTGYRVLFTALVVYVPLSPL